MRVFRLLLYIITAVFAMVLVVAIQYRPPIAQVGTSCSQLALRTIKGGPDKSAIKAVSYYVTYEQRKAGSRDNQLTTAVGETARLHAYAGFWPNSTSRYFCEAAVMHNGAKPIKGFDKILSEVKGRFPMEEAPELIALCLTVEHVNLEEYNSERLPELKRHCEKRKEGWKFLGRFL